MKDKSPVTVEPFHRVERPWWRALVEAVLLAILFFVWNIGAALFLALTGFLLGMPEEILDMAEEDLDVNILLLISLAMTIAAPLLAARLSGRNPAELLSVEKRVRARPALIALAAAVAGYAVLFLASVLVDGTPDATVTTRGILFIVFCVLLVPVQAATEELIFRAAIPQIVGSWVKSPWISYGLAVPLFAAAHAYNWIGLTDIVIFAICAAVLTWYTGGIEAATVLHAVGNIFAFAGLGLGYNNPTESDVTWDAALPSIAMTVALTLMIFLALRRWGGSMRESFHVTNSTQPGLTSEVAYQKEAHIGGEEEARRAGSGQRP